MKNLLFIAFSICFLSLAAQAQDEGVMGPVMTFENGVVDYGDIEQHADPLRKAEFTNTGTEPLIIQNARGSCGCTVPTWPKEPIMPGQTAEIEIRYDTKRLGSINKKVTITTNEPDGANTHILKVVGRIHKADAGVPEKKDNMFAPNNNKEN